MNKGLPPWPLMADSVLSAQCCDISHTVHTFPNFRWGLIHIYFSASMQRSIWATEVLEFSPPSSLGLTYCWYCWSSKMCCPALGGKIVGFQHCHLIISSQMLKNSMKILVLYRGFHFLVENHIKLSFLWNMENSTCHTCVMLLQKREIPDTDHRDRQLVCSALAGADQPTLK